VFDVGRILGRDQRLEGDLAAQRNAGPGVFELYQRRRLVGLLGSRATIAAEGTAGQ